jgi:hypothetical protein
MRLEAWPARRRGGGFFASLTNVGKLPAMNTPLEPASPCSLPRAMFRLQP